MITSSDLIDRAERVRSDIAGHKAAIRRHRRALGESAAALAALEAECRRRGIGFRQEEQNDATHRDHPAAN